MVNKFSTLIVLFTLAFPDILYGITTIHHDKPSVESRISSETVNRRQVPSNVFPERQKRLLPYVNYYLTNQRKPEKFTPFLESNALPGPFVPIVKPKNEYAEPPPEKNPNYADIFETLSQLKQAQDSMRHDFGHYFSKPDGYVPVQYYDIPSKTTIETFTPTNIDIDVEEKKYSPVSQEYRQKPQIVDSYVIEKHVPNYRPQATKPYLVRKPVVLEFNQEKPNPIILEYSQKPKSVVIYGQNEKPVTFVTTTSKPHTIVEESYEAQKFIPIEHHQHEKYITQSPVEPHQENIQYATEKPQYVEYFSSPAPDVNTEDTNILGRILKQLQTSNTLPQTFTPQNIDTSIKTLVKILNGLRKQEGLKEKPIIVVEEEPNEEIQEEVIEKPIVEKISYNPESYQIFPANTIEGGTPGRPGIDYPALSSIPQTDFNCKTQRYKGFFGDPHTNCQVWHYCDLNGGQASFLCPNGTIFSQVALTCDWWYNVKCSSTAQLYVLNERLYKYILPLTPKFPEDYSGPLVDRYLALKFQEMEEKMKKNKKKEDKSEEKDDSDQLQDINNERAKSSSEES